MNQAQQGQAQVIWARFYLGMTHPGTFPLGQHPFLPSAVVGGMTQGVLGVLGSAGNGAGCPFCRGHLGGCQERRRRVLTRWLFISEVPFRWRRLLCSELERKPGNSESIQNVLLSWTSQISVGSHQIVSTPTRFSGKKMIYIYLYTHAYISCCDMCLCGRGCEFNGLF